MLDSFPPVIVGLGVAVTLPPLWSVFLVRSGWAVASSDRPVRPKTNNYPTHQPRIPVTTMTRQEADPTDLRHSNQPASDQPLYSKHKFYVESWQDQTLLQSGKWGVSCSAGLTCSRTRRHRGQTGKQENIIGLVWWDWTECIAAGNRICVAAKYAVGPS